MHIHPEDLIRGLGRRFTAVLLIVAGLLTADQVMLQPLLIRLNQSAPVINLSGRQRMLSQHLLQSALILARNPDSTEQVRPQLESALSSWVRVHRGLQFGDDELDLPGTTSPPIRAAFQELDPHHLAMAAAVQQILSTPEDPEASISTLLRHERPYLQTMDRIVAMFEAEAREQVRQLRWIGFAVTAVSLLLMAGLSWLVLKPAIRLIRRQFREMQRHQSELQAAREQLEQRVVERTEELVRTNDALAHATRVTHLGQLATGIAHEINQPLGAITNYAETLDLLVQSPAADTNEIRTISRRLRDAALRAGQIVHRMREFVRPRPSNRQSARLGPIIVDVLDLCGPELRQHEVQVERDLDEIADVELIIDPIQLQQVLVNLVRNAIQAMAELPKTRRQLIVRGTTSSNTICLSVSDSGPGFPAELLSQTFQPFQSTKPGGLGMGLSISQSIAASYGGELRAENLAAGGACVTLELPFRSPHD